MSKLRDLVVGLPAACDVPGGLAQIFGEFNGKLFDFELANPDGPLARKNFATVAERVALGLEPWKRFANPKKYAFAVMLLNHAAHSIDGGKPSSKDLEQLNVAQADPGNASISALMTVGEAGTLSSWA